jgi:hypothetical protein
MGDVAGSPEDDSHAAAPPHSGSSRRGPTSPHSFTGRHRQHWLMALGGPVLSVVAIAVGVLIVVHAVQATDLPLGRGTGTFTWPNDGSGEGGSSQGFNGTAGRFQVSGRATQPTSDVPNVTPAEIANGTVKFPTTVQVASLRGTIDNKHFTLEPTLRFSVPKSQMPSVAAPAQKCTTTSTPDSVSIDCPLAGVTHFTHKKSRLNPRAFPVGYATGTFGSMKVRATITADAFTRSFGFAGTIGTLRLTGEFTVVDHDGKAETAHATFDVAR